MDETRFIV